MPSSNHHVPNPHNPKRAAKILLKAIRSGDPDSIRRVQAVFNDLKNIPDADVPDRMSLMRCQHVIAKEHGSNNWTDLNDKKLFQVHVGGANLMALYAEFEHERPGSRIYEMISDLLNYNMTGYLATGTRKECQMLIAWTDNAHRKHPSAKEYKSLQIESLRPPEDDPIDADFDDYGFENF